MVASAVIAPKALTTLLPVVIMSILTLENQYAGSISIKTWGDIELLRLKTN